MWGEAKAVRSNGIRWASQPNKWKGTTHTYRKMKGSSEKWRNNAKLKRLMRNVRKCDKEWRKMKWCLFSGHLPSHKSHEIHSDHLQNVWRRCELKLEETLLPPEAPSHLLEVYPSCPPALQRLVAGNVKPGACWSGHQPEVGLPGQTARRSGRKTYEISQGVFVVRSNRSKCANWIVCDHCTASSLYTYVLLDLMKPNGISKEVSTAQRTCTWLWGWGFSGSHGSAASLLQTLW